MTPDLLSGMLIGIVIGVCIVSVAVVAACLVVLVKTRRGK